MARSPTATAPVTVESLLQQVLEDSAVVGAYTKAELSADVVLKQSKALLEPTKCPLDITALELELTQLQDRRDQYLKAPEQFRSRQRWSVALFVLEFCLIPTGFILFGFGQGAAGVASLVAGIVAMFGGLGLSPDSLVKSWREKSGLADALPDFDRFTSDLKDRLRSFVVLRAIRDLKPPEFHSPGSEAVRLGHAARLSSRTDDADRIDTAGYRSVLLAVQRPGGATIGLAGPRGIGKSEILRALCEVPAKTASLKDGGTVGVVVPCPTVSDGVSFLRHLLRRLAQAVPGVKLPPRQLSRLRRYAGYGALAGLVMLVVGIVLRFDLTWPRRSVLADWLMWPGASLLYVSTIIRAIRVRQRKPTDKVAESISRSQRKVAAAVANDVIRRLRYVETLESQREGSLVIGKLTTKLGSKVSRAEVPLGLSDLLAEFERLVESLNDAGYRVLVGIDELDKMEQTDGAETFLNEIKSLFVIRKCSFVVTISDSALAKFNRRSVDVRDVFDSSLDDTIEVKPMDFYEARNLVRWRAEKMTDTEVLFGQCLTGGNPREFLRYSRALATAGRSLGATENFQTVLARILLDELNKNADGVLMAARSSHLEVLPTATLELERLMHHLRRGEFGAVLNAFLASDQPFALACHPVDELSSQGFEPAQKDDWYTTARRQLHAYLFLNRTMQQAFDHLDELFSRGVDSTLTAFEALVTAKCELELDPGSGWRHTELARQQLGLEALSVAGASPSPMPGTPTEVPLPISV